MTTISHGLYYVTRTSADAYVLSGHDIPPIDPVERAVMLSLFSTAKNMIAAAQNNDGQLRRGGWNLHPAAGPVAESGEPNALGLPFGLYYVTIDGSAVYAMSGPDAPDLREPELSVAQALVYHAHTVLHRASIQNES